MVAQPALLINSSLTHLRQTTWQHAASTVNSWTAFEPMLPQCSHCNCRFSYL